MCILTAPATHAAQPPVADASRLALPVVGTDQLTLMDAAGGRTIVRGSIAAITGDRLSIRLNGKGTLKIFRLPEVQQLHYYRPLAWQEGLAHEAKGNWSEALAAFERALAGEDRDWAWCELQALAAATEIRRGTRWEAVDRIEKILEKDGETRHVALLPLVWDDRLSAASRLTATAEQLRSHSVVHRLAAASALLGSDSEQLAAETTLKKIVQAEHHSRIGQLASAQLWRLPLLSVSHRPKVVLEAWREQVQRMPADLRHGPLYVMARLTEASHNYDLAATDYLWLPLMDAPDPALAALSMEGAIRCLDRSGQPAAAARLRSELNRRFAESIDRPIAVPPVERSSGDITR